MTLDVVAKKMRSDSAGKETEVPMDDLVDIGVFAPGEGDGLRDPLGTGLLFVAGLLSGRLGTFRGRARWVTAPAVVLAVEPRPVRVRSRFDREGVAQESADEVGTRPWKVGDDCVAVFQPTRPDLATLQPLS